MRLNLSRAALLFAVFMIVSPLPGEIGLPTPAHPRGSQSPARVTAPATVPPMRKASEFIRRQEPIKINQNLLKQTSPDRLRVVVSLSKQRAYLLMGEEVVIDSPISSGKRGHTSPNGSFSVLERDPNHHSTIYGDFVD